MADRLSDKGLAYLTEFIDEYSPRPSGSEEELRTAEFLRDEMEGLGYQAELQDFTVERFSRELPVFTLSDSDASFEEEIRALPMSNSGLGDVSAALVFVQKAFEEDLVDIDLTGAVAVIERGDITFQEKVGRVAEAGAVGAIVYNNAPGGFAGALRDTSPIPAVSITREDGLALLDRLEADEEVVASLFIEMDSQPSQNVIAEKPGTAPDGGVVIIGAHYDSVEDTQAANDNSTGITSLVLMAEELQDKEYSFTLKFVFFGVEEIGLFGSRHYVSSLSEEEHADIIAMLNFDSLGAGEAAVMGDADLLAMITKYSSDNGLFVTVSPGLTGGSSDHASFQAAGIPAVFFFGDDFSRINSPQDTLPFVRPDIMGRQMAMGLALLDMLANAQ